MAIKKIAKLLT